MEEEKSKHVSNYLLIYLHWIDILILSYLAYRPLVLETRYIFCSKTIRLSELFSIRKLQVIKQTFLTIIESELCLSRLHNKFHSSRHKELCNLNENAI